MDIQPVPLRTDRRLSLSCLHHQKKEHNLVDLNRASGEPVVRSLTENATLLSPPSLDPDTGNIVMGVYGDGDDAWRNRVDRASEGLTTREYR